MKFIESCERYGTYVLYTYFITFKTCEEMEKTGRRKQISMWTANQA